MKVEKQDFMIKVQWCINAGIMLRRRAVVFKYKPSINCRQSGRKNKISIFLGFGQIKITFSRKNS